MTLIVMPIMLKELCVFKGQGASALQAGFHTRRPPVQRGRRGRPVPPTRDVGSPIEACAPAITRQGQTGSYSMKGYFCVCFHIHPREKDRGGGEIELHSTFQLHIPYSTSFIWPLALRS